HSLEPGIGEAAERERLRQVRRIRDFLIIGLVIAVAGLPFTAGLFNGLTGGPAAEPRWVHAAPAALSTLIAAVGGWLGWRRADELKRRRAINT
ncbi:hypothetical protein, partial [Enterococcus faecium]|uniref:hypothetical protein n=2 Tax=Bacteria TaxID=2 RepID=UPI003F522E26